MHLNSEKTINTFCATNIPAISVSCGQTIAVETLDAYGEQLLPEGTTREEMDTSRGNLATGPIYVEGAEPGDTLTVKIESIETKSTAVVTCRKGAGFLGHMVEGSHVRRVPVRDKKIFYSDEIVIPIDPMIGVIGVAPANGESINSYTPGKHGGNMDNKMIKAGATLYFPVAVPGALLALGDCHAIMGDGEVGISGAEISSTTTITVDVIKDRMMEYPMLENDDTFSVIASKEDLDGAALRATELMLEFLEARTVHSRPDLVMLMSLIGSLEICQVVDPLLTVRFVMPKKYFPGLRF